MAPFRYRLQVLLDRRIEAKQEAQRTLGQRQAELEGERKALEAADRERERIAELVLRARQELMQAPGGPSASGEALRARRDYLRSLHGELESAKGAVFSQKLRIREVEDRLANARNELAQRSREVEALEKHRGRLESRFQREVDRKDALEQEEMGTIIFLQRRKDT